MKQQFLQPCARWTKHLAVQSDDLAAAERAALEAHLASCQACAAAYAEYRQLDRTILAVPSPAALAGLPPRLLELWAAEDRAASPLRALRRSGTHVLEDGMQREREQGAGTSAPPTIKPRARARRRALSVLSLMAAVLATAVILAALLASRAPKTPPTSSQGPTTATNTPGKSGWQPIPGLSGQSGVPVIAPSNPQVVYEAINNGQIALQRSDDAGADWQALPVPAGASTQASFVQFFVNPLNPQQVYLEINSTCATSQISGNGPAAVFSAGGCATDYVSADAGAHWQLANWPLPATDLHHTRLGEYYSYAPFKTQGTRLYALLAVGNAAGTILLTSSDGGVSWQPADQPLRAQSNCVSDFAPTPTGATIFALAAGHCTLGSTAALASLGDTTSSNTTSLAVPLAGGGGSLLWRSDDAGAHWSKVGLLPGLGVDDHRLSAFSQADGAQPVLYDDGFLPPNNTIPPTVTKVSLDGGKTWQAVPAQGQVQYADSGLLGMLGDGSIVEAFRGKLFAWKAGDAAWHQVAPQLPGSFSNLLIFSNGAGTPATFWALTQGNSGYSFYLYQQK